MRYRYNYLYDWVVVPIGILWYKIDFHVGLGGTNPSRIKS